MNLHYSQTESELTYVKTLFYYLMNLHYSQTYSINPYHGFRFYYLMNLHYSQTSNKLRPLYSTGKFIRYLYSKILVINCQQ